MKRNPHQFNLNDTELQDIFDLSDDPKRLGSKGRALRTVIERHKELIDDYTLVRDKLKSLTK